MSVSMEVKCLSCAPSVSNSVNESQCLDPSLFHPKLGCIRSSTGREKNHEVRQVLDSVRVSVKTYSSNKWGEVIQ